MVCSSTMLCGAVISNLALKGNEFEPLGADAVLSYQTAPRQFRCSGSYPSTVGLNFSVKESNEPPVDSLGPNQNRRKSQ